MRELSWKEEGRRIAVENKTKEEAAIQARQRQRETIISDTVTVLIGNLKSKLAKAKGSTSIAELNDLSKMGKIIWTSNSTMDPILLGSRQASRSAVAFISSVDSVPVPTVSDYKSPIDASS